MARYIHRVAISNQRLVSIDNNSVTFLYNDYARGNCRQPMTLTADEFLRRLSLHILPRGFVRVRAFGFLANCHRQEKLALVRRLLQAPPPAATSDTVAEMPEARSAPRCPHCGQAALYTVRRTHRPRVPELIARTYLCSCQLETGEFPRKPWCRGGQCFSELGVGAAEATSVAGSTDTSVQMATAANHN